MSEPTLDELLGRMDAIAVAVNKFSAESVQQAAFTALMKSAGVASLDEENRHQEQPTPKKVSKKSESSSGGSATKGKRSKQTVSVDKDINLRPEGKDSFKALVDAKKPTTNHERNVVALYYLLEVLELQKVGSPQILACYREAEWKIPSNIKNSLQVTATAKSWLDSAESDDLKLRSSGENTVKFDLPKAA